MSEEQKAALNEALQDLWVNGNLGVLDEIYATDFVRHSAGLPDIVGLKAYKEYVEATFTAWSDIRLTLDDVVVEGDKTAARWTLECTHAGPLPISGLPATGKRVTIKGCSVSHTRGNKTVESWEYMDLLGMYRQLGVAPPMVQG